MDKHRNADGTYDGAGFMGEVTGLGRAEMVKLWEQVKENHARLNACPYHEFVPILPLATKPRFRCRYCGGEVDASAYHWHEQGRRVMRPIGHDAP